MRTDAVKCFSHVAIMAKNLKALFRIVLFFQPTVNFTAWNRQTMFSPASVYMVNSEKFKTIFSTTDTFPPVLCKSLKSVFSLTVFRAFVAQLFISEIPFFMIGALFFWIFTSVFPNRVYDLFSIVIVIFWVTFSLIVLLAFFAPTMQAVFSVFTTLEKFKCGWKFPLTFGTAFRYNVHIRTSNIGFGQAPDCFSNAGEISLCDYYNITTQKGV